MNQFIEPPEVFALSKTERNNHVWIRLKAHLNARLVTLRNQNDGDLSIEDTSRMRGRIAEIKALLQLDHDE